MCVDCWNAGMAAPAAVVAGRFAWIGYRDRITSVVRRGPARPEPVEVPDTPVEADDEPVEVGVGVGVGPP